jgi:tetratricopeptide (TPR) repeat protein/serine/threonine protein kinase
MNAATEHESLESLVARVADDFLEQQKRGEQPDVEEYAARYPQHAAVLREVLAALQIVGLSKSAGDQPGLRAPEESLAAPLGDFRIIREVGRGGMGVVYEAEQMSLDRRVALKVLPFAATMDPRQLQRFQNEARAAASLEHPHIVPVHGVGCERGVHYYAMKFIDGQSLAEVISEVNRAKELNHRGTENTEKNRITAVSSLCSLCLCGSNEFFKSVAELGLQAAEALEHAHSVGIVHRDIKPANLMIDGRGALWITDFGLARTASDDCLTMTGDVLGTLRYMSPEQALAKHGLVDHRTDVYSLGVTLYELLTGTPAVNGKDREEILNAITLDEPRPPRTLNAPIPRDLETIVLKAMAKNPADRYATAQELADDLRHWLEDRPIRARRPPPWLRLRRWGRRHRALVACMAAVMTTMLVMGVVWAVGHQRRQAETERGVTAALVQAETLVDEGDKLIEHPERWQAKARLAQAALEKAEELLAAGVATTDLAKRVEQDRAAVEGAVADSELLVEVERIQLELAASENKARFNLAASAYAKALGNYGVNLAALEAAGERIRGSRLRTALLAALEDWWRVSHDEKELKQLDQVLLAVDPPRDVFRARWREAVRRRDGATLVKMAAELPKQRLTPILVCCRARDLLRVKEWKVAERLLKAAQVRNPGDFWLNHELGLAILLQGRARGEETARAREAVGYLRAALVLRSDSPAVHNNLGSALMDQGDLDEAIGCFQVAIKIDRNYAVSHHNLGGALKAKGKVDEAIACYKRAIDIDPTHADFHYNLGVAWKERGKVDEAIACYKRAIKIDPREASYHYNLGVALAETVKVDEAIPYLREAIRLNPRHARAHGELGVALMIKDKVDEAIDWYKIAIDIDPTDAFSHYNLGVALARQGKQMEAAKAFRKAIKLKPNFADAHYKLGVLLHEQRKLVEAVEAYRKAIGLKHDTPVVHFNLGNALLTLGQTEDAVKAFQRAIVLNPKYAEAHYDLGNAFRIQGKLPEAKTAYLEAIGVKPEYAEAHCNLGLVLVSNELFAEALPYLRSGHELGRKNRNWHYSSAEWVQFCERLLRLKSKLPLLLSGKERPMDTADRIALAWFCSEHNTFNAAAARFYAEAFAEQPALATNPQSPRRCNAACAAALAGCRKGKDAADLGEEECARLRRQALNWLRAELAACRQLQNKQPDAAAFVQRRMQNLLKDEDVAGVRDPEALAHLPDGERQEWNKLWKEVEALRQRAAQLPGTASSARP